MDGGLSHYTVRKPGWTIKTGHHVSPLAPGRFCRSFALGQILTMERHHSGERAVRPPDQRADGHRDPDGRPRGEVRRSPRLVFGSPPPPPCECPLLPASVVIVASLLRSTGRR